MRKPRWIGSETPDITAIRNGRDWADLEDREWRTIEAIVAGRPAMTQIDGTTVRGTRRSIDALRRSRLWKARRALVDDPELGIVEWTGQDNEPDHPTLIVDRPLRPGRRRGSTTIQEDEQLRAPVREMRRAGRKVTLDTLAASSGFTRSEIRGYLKGTDRGFGEFLRSF